MWFLQLVIALSAILCVDTWYCPVPIGDSCNQNDDLDGQCVEGVCLSDLDRINNKTHSFCCDQNGTFCTATGFESRYYHSGKWIHKFHYKTTNRSIYYKDPVTSAACEFPFFLNPVSNMLPIDFTETGTTKLKQCKNNTECEEGTSCGEVTNRQGQSMYFCYKSTANDNRVASWAEVDKFAKLEKLGTIYLERNPIYTNDISSYRRKVMLTLPQITQLDATLCRK